MSQYLVNLKAEKTADCVRVSELVFTSDTSINVVNDCVHLYPQKVPWQMTYGSNDIFGDVV